MITGVKGTGLLVAAEIDPDRSSPWSGTTAWRPGAGATGLGVIHGGKNALRATPHFAITSEEVELIVRVVRQGLRAVLSAQLTPEPVRDVEVAR
ncbi:MAG: hypothetical protein R3F59_06895 [Myxococcota bacterium]